MSFSREEIAAGRTLVTLALAEDLSQAGDLTSQAVIPAQLKAQTMFVARASGVLAGLPAAALVAEMVDPKLAFKPKKKDGTRVQAGDILATMAGPMRSILAAERVALNFLQHLSGIASLTRQYVDAVAGLPCKILDTRKTIPGWRLLAKYAVRQGGGCNQRMGLYDGILIKDNHMAALRAEGRKPPGEDAAKAALTCATQFKPPGNLKKVPIEVEVESLAQLESVLACRPALVLLDNMKPPLMRKAVQLRAALSPATLLEASGGVNLRTVRAIAETGVERISVGALTHSAPALDIALDYDWSSAQISS